MSSYIGAVHGPFCRLPIQWLRGSRQAASAALSFQESLRNVPETQVTVLGNGLRVSTENSGLRTCTVSRRQALSA